MGIHRHMWAFIRPMDVYGMHRSEASAQRLGELLATADTRDELATQIGHMGRKDHTAAELMRTCANEIADESSARDTATRTAHSSTPRAMHTPLIPPLRWARAPQAREVQGQASACLLYTSPSPRDLSTSRMPSSA